MNKGNTTSRIALCCTASALSLWTAPALAQQAGASDATVGQQRLAQPMQEAAQAPARATSGLQDIVVTARRSAERAQDVPIAITTVTADSLRDLNVRDIIEVQKVTPGLYMNSQNSSGRVKVTIRGQSEADSRLTTDPSVGIYIDGVNYHRTYGLRSAFVDLAQVEVLKGPQGTLFGKNTTGGAINITTQRPKYEAGGYVDLLYGSYNNMQALAVLNVPLIDDKLAIRAVGQVISRDGFGRQFDGRDIGDDNVVNGRLLIRADPADNVRILLSGDYVLQRNIGTNVILTADRMLASGNSATGSLGAIAAELGLNPAVAADRLTAYNRWRSYYDAYQGPLFQSGFNSGNSRSLFDDLDHYGVSADIAVDIGDVTVKSVTAWRRLTREYVQDLDGTPFSLLDVNLSTEQENFSQELQISAIDGEGLDWQVGAYYNRETGNEFSSNNTNAFVNSARSSVNDTDSVNSSIAGYGQAVVHLAEALRFTGGLRYTDDYREIDSHSRRDPSLAVPPAVPASIARCHQLAPAFGGPVFPNCTYTVGRHFRELTWLASADWKPSPDVLLYASMNKGYRAGGFVAQAFSAPFTPAQLAGAAEPFKPEKVLVYEAGFKSDLFDRRVRLNGAVYYQDYTNIQQQDRVLVDGVTVTFISNAANATLWGGELEATIVPTDTTTISLGASYLNAQFDEYITRLGQDLSDQPFPAPEWTFNIGLNQTVPLPDGELRFNVNYAWTDDVVFRAGSLIPASVSQQAFGLIDARVTWRIDSLDLELSVFGKNLADKEYLNGATNLESLGYNTGFPADPRTVGFQMRKNF